MLSKCNDSTTHAKNIQKLMIEFFQYLCGLSVLIKKEVFEKSSLNITFAVVK